MTIIITIYNASVLHQDFVDVTLACADGATIAAHKVILSSVSTYFRDILKVGGGEEQTLHTSYEQHDPDDTPARRRASQHHILYEQGL